MTLYEQANQTAMGVFGWGEVEIDLDAIPRETFIGLAKQGIIHKLGNEVAANIVKVKEKADKDNPDEVHDEAWLEETKIELRKVMVDKILNGTIGLRIGGPRGNTIENIAFELAMKQAEATLAPKGYWPKADRKNGVKAEDAVINFNGVDMTRDDLADVVLKQYKDKFMAEAEIEHKARMEKAKLAKASQVPVQKEVKQSAEDLLASLSL